VPVKPWPLGAGMWPAIASCMSIKRPVHPLLLALPIAAYAVTLFALLMHVAVQDPVWYEVALIANLGGLIATVVATIASVVDAANLPAHTVAREAGLSQVAFDALAMVLFAASATLIYSHFVQSRVVSDAAPLLLAALGMGAMGVAGWYGRIVLRLFQLGQTIMRYPAQRRPARHPHPRTLPTLG
jgi:uncharacterized membrane protein